MSMDLEMETHGCQCSFAGAFSWFGPLEENIGFEGYFEIEEIFPTNGCFDDKSPLPDLDGKIALVNRGECSFARKVALAERSGAIGVIIVNTLEPNNLFVMGDNSPNRLVGIPSMMIEYGSGEILRACLREQRETLSSNEIWVKFSFKNVPIVETKTISGIQTDFMYQSLGDLKLRIHKEKNLYHLNFL